MDVATEQASTSRAAAHGSYAVTVEFELADGAFDEFYGLVMENARESVASERGCMRFDVLTPSSGPASRVFLYEIYSDRAAFDVHLASKHFRSFDERTGPLVRRKTVHDFAVAQNAKNL